MHVELDVEKLDRAAVVDLLVGGEGESRVGLRLFGPEDEVILSSKRDLRSQLHLAIEQLDEYYGVPEQE